MPLYVVFVMVMSEALNLPFGSAGLLTVGPICFQGDGLGERVISKMEA